MVDLEVNNPPKRWNAQRKASVVLRLLRSEPIDEVSRDIGVPVSRLEEWRDQALQSMTDGLKARINDPLEAELSRAKKQLGELTMENVLLRERCRRSVPLARGRSKK